jgi:hypothetical protein
MALNKGDSQNAGDLGLMRDGNQTKNDVLEKFPVKNRIGENNPYVGDSRGNKTGTAVDQPGWSK